MWFSARLIIRCTVGQEQKDDFLFDEQVRIIEAKDKEEAYEKALTLDKNEETRYKNSEGEMVEWSFEGLFDLEKIDKLEDGSEISSKRFRANSNKGLVFPKKKLTIFWQETLQNQTAGQILDKEDRTAGE